ncbi:hypothetical protein CYMTET_44794 [Cymbomonas tetramitiformis]|uniref:Uncharacterized protein n=1 Tax=Cymbomonas tetramitiformis TaxID=36881 RepID=A0AAE0BZH8_9CHLO|nr:hypothetical protein CYMTET_44794 [Cymbomonas tetramitiformis]
MTQRFSTLASRFDVQENQLQFLESRIQSAFEDQFSWSGGPLVALKRARDKLRAARRMSAQASDLVSPTAPQRSMRGVQQEVSTPKLTRRDLERSRSLLEDLVVKYGDDFSQEIERRITAAADLESRNAALVQSRKKLQREMESYKNKVASAKSNEARMSGILTKMERKVAIAQSDQNIATAQLAAKRASITDLQGVICQLEGEVAKVSNERDAALEDLLSTHDEYRYLLSKSEDEPEESTLVSLQILPTMEVKDGRKRFMSDRIAEYQRIVHEFKLKGGRISQLFHRVLQFFTGCSEHEARAVARLPQHSQQYDHTQMMGMAKQHSMSIARDESRPFYATECDEAVSITRSKFMLNFVMFGTPDIPIPTRLLAQPDIPK